MSAMLFLVLLAADAPGKSAPAHATAIMEVTDHPYKLVERNGVMWTEALFKAPGDSFECGSPGVPCLTEFLKVENRSSTTLRCRGKIHYPQPNANEIKDVERTVIVPRNRAWNVVRAEAPADMLPTSYEVDCTPEPALPVLDTPSECKSKVIRPADPAAYYTQDAQDALHEGPVFLEFTLAASPGTPSDIEVIQTSAYPDLDAAAVRMFGEIRMTTNCPGKRFRTVTSFKLD